MFPSVKRYSAGKTTFPEYMPQVAGKAAFSAGSTVFYRKFGFPAR
jgi:hypothetical protein